MTKYLFPLLLIIFFAQPLAAQLIIETSFAAKVLNEKNQPVKDAVIKIGADGIQLKTDARGEAGRYGRQFLDSGSYISVTSNGYLPYEDIIFEEGDISPIADSPGGDRRDYDLTVKLLKIPRTAAERRSTAAQIRLQKLLYAVKTGDAPQVEALLKAGANPNARDDTYNLPAIIWAAGLGYDKIIIKLLDNKAVLTGKNNPARTALLAYLDLGLSAQEERNGLDLESLTKKEKEDLIQTNPESYNETVRRLIAAGASINIKSSKGDPVLDLAVSRTLDGLSVETIKLLLTSGAKVDILDQYAATPLFTAVYRSPTLVQILLNAGANPNARDEDGETPLMKAVSENRADIVKLLLTAGADPRAVNQSGESVLFFAQRNRNETIIKLLEDAGAVK